MISVLILTKNESINIRECIDSVRWSDDIVVFDSHSEDNTTTIAESMGARVFKRKFDDYGSQREAARCIPYKNEWVLALDADERPDEILVKELLEISTTASPRHFAYRMRRKDFYRDQWIKHCTLYPSWFIRFFIPRKIRYEPRSVHEYPIVEGEIGQLRGHLKHYSFNKGLEEWFLKHVRYAKLEAIENHKQLRHGSLDTRGLFCFRNPTRRRRALKQLSMLLPFRPSLRFWYMYLLRLGIFDGREGYQYCQMLRIYEEMIVFNLREIYRNESSPHSPNENQH